MELAGGYARSPTEPLAVALSGGARICELQYVYEGSPIMSGHIEARSKVRRLPAMAYVEDGEKKLTYWGLLIDEICSWGICME